MLLIQGQEDWLLLSDTSVQSPSSARPGRQEELIQGAKGQILMTPNICMQTYLRDTVSLVPDHHKKVKVAVN